MTHKIVPGHHYCSKCERVLPISDFHRNRRARSGLQDWCKECFKPLTQRQNVKRREDEAYKARKRAIASQRRAAGTFPRERERRHSIRRREQHPEKVRAHRITNEAIRNGRLKPQDHCEVCGVIAIRGIDGRRLIQAHHDDYTKPLEVRWLCAMCHNKTHRALKDSAP